MLLLRKCQHLSLKSNRVYHSTCCRKVLRIKVKISLSVHVANRINVRSVPRLQFAIHSKKHVLKCCKKYTQHSPCLCMCVCVYSMAYCRTIRPENCYLSRRAHNSHRPHWANNIAGVLPSACPPGKTTDTTR